MKPSILFAMGVVAMAILYVTLPPSPVAVTYDGQEMTRVDDGVWALKDGDDWLCVWLRKGELEECPPGFLRVDAP